MGINIFAIFLLCKRICLLKSIHFIFTSLLAPSLTCTFSPSFLGAHL